ncbi:MAG: ribose 5-phosphate isomerase B [Anaerolineales bacterium]|jgi:ribose 5-phosphate isomerase B
MNVAVACDHAGFPFKELALDTIRSMGHTPLDLGTDSTDPVDYPDYAEKVGQAVQKGEVERGLLVCGSGVGAAIAACKMRGVRAGVCHDAYSARQAVEHDNVNVLALGARVIGPALARVLIREFLAAEFTREERHERRLAKISALEDAATHQGER